MAGALFPMAKFGLKGVTLALRGHWPQAMSRAVPIRRVGAVTSPAGT